MRSYALSFPAINGEVVTEGHARYCRENGCATNTIDGVQSIFCPRCGDALTTKVASTSVTPVSNDKPEATEMRTYAEYLNTMTVKTLNTIARDMGLKGYSKLRKAELIAFIDNAIATDHDEAFVSVQDFGNSIKILDVEVAEDHAAIAEIMASVDTLPDSIIDEAEAQVAPVVFSQTPVKPAESVAETVSEQTQDDVTVEEIVTAYFNMKATWNRASGERARRLMGKLINLRNQVKAMGHNPIELRMGYTVA